MCTCVIILRRLHPRASFSHPLKSPVYLLLVSEWYKPNSCLDFPIGGSQAMADALARCGDQGGGMDMRPGQARHPPGAHSPEDMSFSTPSVLRAIHIIKHALRRTDVHTGESCIPSHPSCRGVTKRAGGRVMTNSHVERIIMEGGRAVGVTLRGGGVIRASKAVVSNASVWDTVTKLLPKEHVPEQVSTRSMGYLVLCNLTYFTSH